MTRALQRAYDAGGGDELEGVSVPTDQHQTDKVPVSLGANRETSAEKGSFMLFIILKQNKTNLTGYRESLGVGEDRIVWKGSVDIDTEHSASSSG